MAGRTLGVGFIGSGFITKFHIRAWQAVRGADVRGVWSPTRARAEEAAALARELRVGDARAFDSIAEMAADPSIDCIWVCGPNFARVENMEEIAHARAQGRRARGHRLREAARPQRRRGAPGPRAGRAGRRSSTAISRTSCSRRASSAARHIVWARGAALAGRPYLARAAEEHGGPHMPWFWQRRPAGRRRAQRHDVPQPRGGALPADQAGRAAPQHPCRPRSRRRWPRSSGRGPSTWRCSRR